MRYQRARLQYQFSKLTPIKEGTYPAYGGNIEFELFSFFEICYHLKDWVKNSPGYSSFSDVENFINATPAMRICADICNRLKHRTLSRKRRSLSEIGDFKIDHCITVYSSESNRQCSARIERAVIETERGEECCFSLAKECMDAWDEYFKANSV